MLVAQRILLGVPPLIAVLFALVRCNTPHVPEVAADGPSLKKKRDHVVGALKAALLVSPAVVAHHVHYYTGRNGSTTRSIDALTGALLLRRSPFVHDIRCSPVAFGLIYEKLEGIHDRPPRGTPTPWEILSNGQFKSPDEVSMRREAGVKIYIQQHLWSASVSAVRIPLLIMEGRCRMGNEIFLSRDIIQVNGRVYTHPQPLTAEIIPKYNLLFKRLSEFLDISPFVPCAEGPQ